MEDETLFVVILIFTSIIITVVVWGLVYLTDQKPPKQPNRPLYHEPDDGLPVHNFAAEAVTPHTW
ncbi:hypothetical protein GGS21DRAFT_487892 [Xylaria nigripes]|nr:hypothetical protein GGS21DRAFT_487892 [Xylaria nigripes]